MNIECGLNYLWTFVVGVLVLENMFIAHTDCRVWIPRFAVVHQPNGLLIALVGFKERHDAWILVMGIELTEESLLGFGGVHQILLRKRRR